MVFIVQHNGFANLFGRVIHGAYRGVMPTFTPWPWQPIAGLPWP
jgi:hypothetical protein